MKKQHEEITIKELIDIFLPKVWIIAMVAIVFAAAFGGYSMFMKDDTYTSTASFIMIKIPTQYGENSGNGAVTTGLSTSEISAMQSMIAMAEQVMETNEYLSNVKEKLVARDAKYANVSVVALKSMLAIEIVGDATCFDLSAISIDPQLSYDVTDIVYETFPDVIEEVFDSYSITIKIIDPPLKATAPNSKGVLKNAIIGGFGGAILAMLAVFIISKLDVIVRSKEKLEQNFDIPIIGTIPRFESDN
jgi:capsular polysaccharide biosynthesis protein